jgi:hypothetical protein
VLRWFLIFQAVSLGRNININIYKHLLILKDIIGRHIIVQFGFPSVLLVNFLQCLPLIGCRKNPHKKDLLVIGGFQNHFQTTGGFQNNSKRRRPLSVCRNKLSEGGY